MLINKNSYLDNSALHDLVAEELFKDLNGCNAKVTVAERNEEVVLQT